MAKKENAREPKPTSAKKTKPKFTDNSAEGQRARLLEALQRSPMTTIEIRHELDILMPAARIWELKHREGKNIEKVWVDRPTAAGNMHRVALYVLKPQSPRPVQAVLDLVPPVLNTATI